MDNYTTTTLAGLVTTPASVTEYSLDASAPFPTVFKIDATYDPTSENAQSGVAVAEALKTVVIPVDLTFSATSTNAQSGTAVAGALANYLQNAGSIGGLIQISDWHYCQTRVGYSSYSASAYCTAIGARSRAHQYSTALGYQAQAYVGGTMALGANITVKDTGVAAIAINNKAEAANSDNLQTIFYIISEGSALANTYEDGEACLGYIVRDKNGNVQKAGTRKLSELLTNNTNFTPTSLDPDAPEPTPFLPTGITEPIVFEEPEELIPTDQPTE